MFGGIIIMGYYKNTKNIFFAIQVKIKDFVVIWD